MMASSRGDHAEIAVIGLGRMDEEGRRAGRGQRRGDLRADMAAFADAGDDDPAVDRRQHLDGLRERLGQPVVEGRGQRRKAGLLDGHGAQRGGDGLAALVVGLDQASCVHAIRLARSLSTVQSCFRIET